MANVGRHHVQDHVVVDVARTRVHGTDMSANGSGARAAVILSAHHRYLFAALSSMFRFVRCVRWRKSFGLQITSATIRAFVLLSARGPVPVALGTDTWYQYESNE